MFTLAGDIEMMIPIVAIVGGISLGAIGMIGSYIRSMKKEKEREISRREVAAYVAEGSMTAEDAAKILDAGMTAEEKKGE